MKRLVLFVSMVMLMSGSTGCGILQPKGAPCGCGWSFRPFQKDCDVASTCGACSGTSHQVGFSDWGGELINGGIPTSTSVGPGCINCGTPMTVNGGVFEGEVISDGLLDGGATTQPMPGPAPEPMQ